MELQRGNMIEVHRTFSCFVDATELDGAAEGRISIYLQAADSHTAFSGFAEATQIDGAVVGELGVWKDGADCGVERTRVCLIPVITLVWCLWRNRITAELLRISVVIWMKPH